MSNPLQPDHSAWVWVGVVVMAVVAVTLFRLDDGVTRLGVRAAVVSLDRRETGKRMSRRR